jgi:CheY-like chemotaxis protein
MPTGGELTIETGNVELSRNQLQAHPNLVPGTYARLTVRDTGSGMIPEVMAHIFEPFFTTKEVGKGTGLGLATVYGIVTHSGGYIDVNSEPGRGTAFNIFLPAVQEALPERGAESGGPAVRAGRETILLAEDEDQVRRVISLALEREGYSVLAGRDGTEALAVAQRHQGPIQLLLTDVVMPGMGGQELADRLLSLRRGIKVLFLSGYTEDFTHFNEELRPGTAILPKPFTVTVLLRKIRELLDRL